MEMGKSCGVAGGRVLAGKLTTKAKPKNFKNQKS
jgi:hypothetical protein